ncbi:MAG: NADP-dependent phosphogluconate dehydrogenase [Arenicellales bacterium]|nr:NADP-dependent phosphogluconate dehydrogenase [Arenicellales bacterium]
MSNTNKTLAPSTSAEFGIIGLGVMGRNLAYNLADKGIRVVVYDPFPEVRDSFDPSVSAGGPNILAAGSLQEFVQVVKTPRNILIMLKAGEPVTAMIQKLISLLTRGDLIIDGGNSYYKDTERRAVDLEARGLAFAGMGVSGGEKGALEGPAIMLGGSKAAVERILPIMKTISARVGTRPCCEVFGGGGAGHFVKMIHNGIEYAEMQAIAEVYSILRDLMGHEEHQISTIFKQWNEGPLAAYLIEITADILVTQDPDDGMPLVGKVMDVAGQKGTGLWAAQSALELGVPCPSLVEAVVARGLSGLKRERQLAAETLPEPSVEKTSGCSLPMVEKALLTTRLIIFTQGFALLRQAATTYGWPLGLIDAASIWRGGCVIRAALLEDIIKALESDKDIPNLLLAGQFKNMLVTGVPALRAVSSAALMGGVPIPVLGSALSYYDSYRSAHLPANLIQAQRDCFGAHTYERVDKPGTFHSNWQVPASQKKNNPQ